MSMVTALSAVVLVVAVSTEATAQVQRGREYLVECESHDIPVKL
jgi:hypothetical protein